MNLWNKLKFALRKEKVAIKELEDAATLHMNPAEFEEFLRQGGRPDYALMRIENLEDRIKAIAEHPIQKKIIETELLTRIAEILKDIDEKVAPVPEMKSRMQALPTVQELVAVLQKALPETSVEKLNRMLSGAESELDESYIGLLANGELTAEDIAKRLNISRNTASERMSRLAEAGKVKKTRRNRKVFFSLASLGEVSTQNVQNKNES